MDSGISDPDAFDPVEDDSDTFLGAFLVSRSLVTPLQLRLAIEFQRRSKERMRVGEILSELGYLDPKDLIVALCEFSLPVRLGELLVAADRLDPYHLTAAVDEQYRTGDRLGDILIRRGFCSLRDIEMATRFQEKARLLSARQDG